MRVILHLGAHKTATTYIQETLAANAGTLRERGVEYVPLQSMRKVVVPKLREGESLAGALRAGGFEPERETLILSDENLLGVSRDPARTGTYYPDIGARVGAILDAVRGREVSVLLATRSYDRFMSSMYCEYLRHRPFRSPAEYRSWIDTSGFSWTAVVRALCALTGEQAVTLWRYEDFRDVEKEVLGAFSPEPIAWSGPGERVRESLSRQAVAALSAVRPLVGRRVTKRLVGPATRIFPKNDRFPPFTLFDASESARLRERYRADMEEIRRSLPGVSIIEPPMKKAERG